MGVSAPTPLTAAHDTTAFECGDTILNEWLQKTALKNEGRGGSRTFVVCEGNRVVGYYALATGAVEREETSSQVRRNMPDPIPVIVLGRLAVDQAYQKQRIGAGMLKDAVLRVLGVAKQVGIRAILVHAISEDARQFYLRNGFHESPTNNMTLMITLEEAAVHAR